MTLYVDTSCVLKLLFPEPERARVMAVLSFEAHVVVSKLTRLEAIVQLHARRASGLLSAGDARTLIRKLDGLLTNAPFELVQVPSEVIDFAERTVRTLPKAGYCATLDRLHLEIMSALGLGRLLTNDDTQASAARALGFEVTLPR